MPGGCVRVLLMQATYKPVGVAAPADSIEAMEAVASGAAPLSPVPHDPPEHVLWSSVLPSQDMQRVQRQRQQRKETGGCKGEAQSGLAGGAAAPVNDLFSDPSLPPPLVVTVKAGEALYLPAKWWHQVGRARALCCSLLPRRAASWPAQAGRCGHHAGAGGPRLPAPRSAACRTAALFLLPTPKPPASSGPVKPSIPERVPRRWNKSRMHRAGPSRSTTGACPPVDTGTAGPRNAAAQCLAGPAVCRLSQPCASMWRGPPHPRAPLPTSPQSPVALPAAPHIETSALPQYCSTPHTAHTHTHTQHHPTSTPCRYDMKFDVKQAYLQAVERLAELLGLNEQPPPPPPCPACFDAAEAQLRPPYTSTRAFG